MHSFGVLNDSVAKSSSFSFFLGCPRLGHASLSGQAWLTWHDDTDGPVWPLATVGPDGRSWPAKNCWRARCWPQSVGWGMAHLGHKWFGTMCCQIVRWYIYIQMIYVYIWTRYGNMSLPDWLGYLCLGIFLAFTKFSSPTSVAFTGTRYTCGWWACIRHRMERNNGRTSKLCTKFLVLWYRILVYNTGTNANSIRVALTLKVWSTWIIWRRWWTRWLALMASCWVQAEYAWASVRGCSQDKWIEDKIGQDSESKHKCDRKGIRENTQTRAKKIGEALHERRLCATTTFEALQAIYQSSIHGLQQRCCFALRSFAPSLGSRR